MGLGVSQDTGPLFGGYLYSGFTACFKGGFSEGSIAFRVKGARVSKMGENWGSLQCGFSDFGVFDGCANIVGP